MSFMLQPSRQMRVCRTAVAKGLGLNQSAVNPKRGSQSYSQETIYFNRPNLPQLGPFTVPAAERRNHAPTLDLSATSSAPHFQKILRKCAKWDSTPSRSLL